MVVGLRARRGSRRDGRGRVVVPKERPGVGVVASRPRRRDRRSRIRHRHRPSCTRPRPAPRRRPIRLDGHRGGQPQRVSSVPRRLPVDVPWVPAKSRRGRIIRAGSRFRVRRRLRRTDRGSPRDVPSTHRPAHQTRAHRGGALGDGGADARRGTQLATRGRTRADRVRRGSPRRSARRPGGDAARARARRHVGVDHQDHQRVSIRRADAPDRGVRSQRHHRVRRRTAHRRVGGTTCRGYGGHHRAHRVRRRGSAVGERVARRGDGRHRLVRDPVPPSTAGGARTVGQCDRSDDRGA